MGLTNSSIGKNAVDSGLIINRKTPNDKVIALAGNPNVGKSTVFNALTGLNQHTGNWPGKTVANAQGYCDSKENSFVFVDLPGTYSLMAHSAEEEVARNFICFSETDTVVVVCDATCIERNMNLVLQTMEISDNVIVCVNLMDEAKRKGITVDLALLSERLGVPVIGVTARKPKSLCSLLETLDKNLKAKHSTPLKLNYPDIVEKAISEIEIVLKPKINGRLNSRWLSLKLLDRDPSLINEIDKNLGENFLKSPELFLSIQNAEKILSEADIDREILKDLIVGRLLKESENLCKGAVTYKNDKYGIFDRKIDKIFTSKTTGYPVMIILLGIIFWITITGANYPSGLLSDGLFWAEDRLSELFLYLNAPQWLHGVLVLGVYRILAWVVSVMLPPMAIFFPLFTLLEDAGYLPRIAYNLDKPFKKCNACGKQALTMCMGFGCNAAGIVGCRIIDSPRERLLAILTNNFVPCNGRFPTLIAILTMFFIGTAGGLFSSVLTAGMLTIIILLGIIATFLVTKILSKTILKGVPSSFTLELPPYRKPQIGKVLVRSFLDRTIFVLSRAVSVAAPAGLIIWILANVTVDNISLLKHCSIFLDPFANIMGLDGIILMAFILGFPANEIVIPIIIMAYMSNGTITEMSELSAIKDIFLANGWTAVTAINVMLFSLFHWPCSTALITVKKETASIKWTFLAAAIPTAIGIGLCILTNIISKVFI